MPVKRVIWGIIAYLWVSSALAAIDAGKPTKTHPEFKPIRDILAQSEERIDLVRSRFIIERFLDESIDVEANVKAINQIVAKVKQTPRYNDTVEGKLNGIVQYLYLSGEWNGKQPYHYDFDDPLGTSKPENSRLSHYLKTRTGNCVSMPMLVLALGERLNLDMSIATAPLHLFVQLKNEGQFYNFEATAGGLKAGSSYVKEFGITQEALKNGIYLKGLNKKQTVVVMMTELTKYYSERSQNNSDFDKALELTSLMLEHDPKNISAMIIRGNTWRNVLHRDLKAFEAKKMRMTPQAKQHFDALLSRNLQWYEKAESLGWREPTKDYNERYLKMVNEARKTYE